MDELQLLKGFETDTLGIFKVSTEAGDYVSDQLNKYADKEQWEWAIPSGSVQEIYTIKNDFFKIHHDIDHNDFSKFVHCLKSKPADSLDLFEEAVLQYAVSPINENGFKSIPFKNYPLNRKKILLIGDSFTWGHNTPNITNGFADILLSKGYVVYNTGISGADPSQYLAIAKKYIPILRPDIVVANFFLENDVFYHERPTVPYKPIFISTNAGNLITFMYGHYFDSPDSVYYLNLLRHRIPRDGNIINELSAKSVIGTLGWQVLNRLNITFYTDPELVNYWQEGELNKSVVPVANYQLKEVSEIAFQNNASFYLSIIPELKNGHLTSPDDYNNLFTNQDYFIPKRLTIWDYNFRDGHFNRSGHEKYAEHLMSIFN